MLLFYIKAYFSSLLRLFRYLDYHVHVPKTTTAFRFFLNWSYFPVSFTVAVAVAVAVVGAWSPYFFTHNPKSELHG